MHKWLAVLALVVILAWQLVDRSNDAHTAQPKSEKRETSAPTQPTVAGPAGSDAGERAPTVEREPRSVNEPAELTVAPKQVGRVLVRARLSAPPPARFAEQRLQWLVDTDAGERGSYSLVAAPVGETAEVDLTKYFERFTPKPTRVRLRALDLRFDSEATEWRNEESSVELDLSDVPSRLRTEGSATLEVVLDPLRPSVVRGSLTCGGGELPASLEWRLVRRHGEQWVIEADEIQPLLRCGGTFAIPARVGGAVEWLARADGFLPRAGRLETPSVGVYELGALALTRGERLTGRLPISAPGLRLRAVCLNPPEELTASIEAWKEELTSEADLRIVDDSADVEPDGSFEFKALFPTEYRLELTRVRGFPDGVVVALAPDVVRPPAFGLVLSAPLAAVDVECAAWVRGKAQGFQIRSLDSHGVVTSRVSVGLIAEGRARVFVRVGELHEFVCGERVVPVLVHEVGATVNVRL